MKIADVYLEQKRFRFKCKRCADLCFKLGRPPLAKLDVERLEERGHSVKDFLEPEDNGIKRNEDGTCVFLDFDAKQNR